VPDCPNVERVRRELLAVLAELDLTLEVEEKIGDHPSPTVVVDGLDVVTHMTPRPGLSCRLDLPTHAQLIEALRTAAPR
jgi:hypothetical protein